MTVRARLAGRPIARTRVVLRGAGVAEAARTNARGLARIRVAASRPGTVRVTLPEALACSRRVGVAADLVGGQLTG